MALAYSNGMAIGTSAPDFSLPGVDGKTYTLGSFDDAKILVVVFTCNHCPYAKACEDRLIVLQHDYLEKGVRLVAINPNDAERYPDDSFAAMKERAQEKHYPFPYLQDESQEVARAYDAACTPDIFVFDAERKLQYNGRLDDNWQEPHKVERSDLRLLLDSLLNGKTIDFEPVHSMGCSIKWKDPS
ncbi:MAG: thioredoxin family protein [Myxococcales bacterium]|nr:MAG: thioredoxin family protein [Myxococcales bacterium]